MCTVRWIAAVALALAAAAAAAQSYPAKPVRIIVPFAPGGATDIVTRIVAQKLTETWGHTVVVDNRAGAGGNIGADLAAKAPPDGYTLFMPSGSVVTANQHIYKKISFNAEKDFIAITNVASGPQIVAVTNTMPVKTLKDLIALAKARPGQLNFASSGPGDTNHLSAELFQIEAGVNLVHIPYKGAAPGTLSVITGETDMMFSNIVPAVPHVQSGRLRPLGITTLQRSPLLPQVPTIAESAIPGFEVQTLYAILAPSGTPAEVTNRLNSAISNVVRSPDVRRRIEADGSRALTSSPEQLRKVIAAEIEKWKAVIKRAGIKPPQ